MSLTWVSRKNQDFYGQLFGAICTWCIAKQLNLEYYVYIFSNSHIEVHGKYGTNPHRNSMVIMPMTDRGGMKFFESGEVESKLLNRHRVITTTHNMYQHFCFVRPGHIYKDKLLESLITAFTKLFRLKFDLRSIPSGLSRKAGIYIPAKYDESDIMGRLAEEVDEKTPYYLVRDKPTMVELLALTRCKELYIPWDNHFARLSAVCSPFRRFIIYDYPKWSPLIYECSIDELLSHYIPK